MKDEKEYGLVLAGGGTRGAYQVGAWKALQELNIKIKGIGVNLSCYGAIMPSSENMQELKELVEEMEKEFNITFDIISLIAIIKMYSILRQIILFRRSSS